MSYHRGGHSGAVAVSYSTNTMSPLSPIRRYSGSAGSSTSVTSGTNGATNSTYSNYRSTTPSNPGNERNGGYYSSASNAGYRSSSYTFSRPPDTFRRVSYSPSRSVSSYNESSSIVGTSSISGSGLRYGSVSSSSASSSAGSSNSSCTSRERNSLQHHTPRSLAATTAADLYALYSPTHYIPNIPGSSSKSSNWRSSSLASSSGVSSSLHGGDEYDSCRERRDRSYSSETSSGVCLSSNNTSTSSNNQNDRWTTRRDINKRRGGTPLISTSTGSGSNNLITANANNRDIGSSTIEVTLDPEETTRKSITHRDNKLPLVTISVALDYEKNEAILNPEVNRITSLDSNPEPRERFVYNAINDDNRDLDNNNTESECQNIIESRNSNDYTDANDECNTLETRCRRRRLNATGEALVQINSPTNYEPRYVRPDEDEDHDANRGQNNSKTDENSRTPRSRLQFRKDERYGLNGLRNIGNTCFMNSVIQCLSNTRPLLEYLLNEQHLQDINTTTSSMKGALIKAFGQVIQELWEMSGDHVVNTTALKSQIQRFAPRFMGYSQQDAQEFLRYLLEGLHEDVNRVTVKPQPILIDIPDHYSDSHKASESWKRYLRSEDSTIVDVFVGQLRSSLLCTACDHVSVTLDPFWDLSLPIPMRLGTVKLNQCLEHFTKVETLDGDEKPTCSKCQMRRKCTKSFSIQKFPKILVIHLKRFSPTERFRGKLSVLVDFPLTGLDLSAFAAPGVQGCTYNLYGVANHSGTTYSGHYTAYCKHPYSGEWHEYNDSRVSSVPARSVVSSEAYVLFYEQQSPSPHL